MSRAEAAVAAAYDSIGADLEQSGGVNYHSRLYGASYADKNNDREFRQCPNPRGELQLVSRFRSSYPL